MNKIELALLKESIKKVRCSDRMAWGDLKQQISELGYQSWYSAQHDFVKAAKKELFALSDSITHRLIEEYRAKRKEGIAPATVNRELATLKTMFTKAA